MKNSHETILSDIYTTRFEKKDGFYRGLHFLEDYEGSRCQLHYIRDKDKREVDFATVIDGKLDELIEVKLSDSDISSSLKYYAGKLKPRRAIQIVANLKRSFEKNGIQVMSPIQYFTKPPWEGRQ